MKKTSLVFFSFLLSTLSLQVSARWDYTGTIKTILNYGDRAYIQVNGTPTGSQVCTTQNTEFYFVIDPTTADGKSYLSTILTAYASGKTVDLQSKDVCTLANDVPDLKYVWIK